MQQCDDMKIVQVPLGMMTGAPYHKDNEGILVLVVNV